MSNLRHLYRQLSDAALAMCATALAARRGTALEVSRRMKLAAVLVTAAAVLAAPLAAGAQPGMTAPVPAPAPAPVDDSGDKSPGVALGLSLLGTAAGYATFVAAIDSEQEGLVWLGLGGMVVGPSLGHFYAGESGRALGHSLIRVGALGTMFTGAVVMVVDCWDEEDDCGAAGPVLIVGGALLGVGSTLYSIVDAPAAANRHNQERRRLVLTPAPVIGPDRSTGYGVALGAAF